MRTVNSIVKRGMVLCMSLLIPLTQAQSQGDKVPTGTGVTFKHIGPGSGGAMFGMDFHPTNPNIMIYGGDMGAMYRTGDGGKHWKIIGGTSGDQPGMGGVYAVKFNRKNPNIVWSVGKGAYKSLDTGKTWRRMTPWLNTIGAIGLDPDYSNIVYIAEGSVPRQVLNWVKGRIWKTVDGGKSWRELARPAGPLNKDSLKYRNYSNIVVDPNSKVIKGEGHSRVFLAGRGGLFRSENAGKTWKDLSGAFGPGQVCDLKLVNNKKHTVLYLTVIPCAGFAKRGVYKSVDNGNSWKPVNKGLEFMVDALKNRRNNMKLKNDRNAPVFSLMIACSPQNPNRLYAVSWCGLARSDNSGASWQKITTTSSYAKSTNGEHVAMLKDHKIFKKSMWGGLDQVQRMTAAASNADIVTFTDNQDLYRSMDGGKTWSSISYDYGKAFDKKLFPGMPPSRYTHTVKSRGVSNIVSDQMKLDPFDPKTYYAAYMDIGLQISRDGGKYWAHVTRGTHLRGHAWAIAVDPGKRGRVFFSMGLTRGQPGGIYRSDDYGKHWKNIGLGDKGVGKIGDIAIDLKSPVSRRIIYLSTEKKGILKSVDGGNSWKNITPNFKGGAKNATCMSIDPKSSKSLYAGTGAGLFRSDNAGKTWKQLGKGLFEKIENISICRSVPSRMYICAHLPGKNGYWGETHIWRSDDAGKSFKNITPPYFRYPGAVAVNPFDPNYLYACNNLMNSKSLKTNGQKMLIVRSKDGGKTWKDIGNGVGFCRGKHIFIDPKNPKHFFVHARFGVLEGWDQEAPVK